MPLPPPPPKGILKPHDPPRIASNFGTLPLPSKSEWFNNAKHAISSTLSRLKSKSSSSPNIKSKNLEKKHFQNGLKDQEAQALVSSEDTLVSNSLSNLNASAHNKASSSAAFVDILFDSTENLDSLSSSHYENLSKHKNSSAMSSKFVISSEDSLVPPVKHVTFDESPLWIEYETYQNSHSEDFTDSEDEYYYYNSHGEDVNEITYAINCNSSNHPENANSSQFQEIDSDEVAVGEEKSKSIFNAMSLIRRDTFSKKLQQRKKHEKTSATSKAQNIDKSLNKVLSSSLSNDVLENTYSSFDFERNDPASLDYETAFVHEPLVKDPELITSTDVFLYYLQSCEKRNQEPLQSILQTYQNAVTLPETLDLSNVVIGSNHILSLTDLLSLKIKLNTLILNNNGLDNDILKLILYTLLNYGQISHLSLTNNKKIQGNGFKYISVFIKKAHWLTSLDLSGIPLDRKACTYLGHVLSHMSPETGHFFQSNLKSLKLDGCKLKATTFDVMTTGILHSKLENLSLRQNKLTNDAAISIAQILSPSSSTAPLKSLDLRSNELKHGLSVLAQAIAENRQLKSFNIRDNKIDHESLRSFSKALRKNKSIETLDISGNTLYEDERIGGILSLKKALLENVTLKNLSMSNTNLHSVAAIEFAEGIPLYQSLQTWDLSYNPIGVAGAMAFAAALRLNFTMNQLELTPILQSSKNGGIDEDPDLAQHLNNISIYLYRNKHVSTEQTSNKCDEKIKVVVSGTMFDNSISSSIDNSSLVEPNYNVSANLNNPTIASHDQKEKQPQEKNLVLKELDTAIENLHLLDDMLHQSAELKAIQGISRSPSQEQIVEDLFKQLYISASELVQLEETVMPNIKDKINAFKTSLSKTHETFQRAQQQQQHQLVISSPPNAEKAHSTTERHVGSILLPPLITITPCTPPLNGALRETMYSQIEIEVRHDPQFAMSQISLSSDSDIHSSPFKKERIKENDKINEEIGKSDIMSKSASSFSLGSVDLLISQLQTSNKQKQEDYGNVDSSGKEIVDENTEVNMQELDQFIAENDNSNH